MKEGEPVTRIVRPLRSGQITIPASFRERLGIGPDSLLQMTLSHGDLCIRPVRATKTVADSSWFKELYDQFAPVRHEAETAGYTEGEIDAEIDAAVRAVRARRSGNEGRLHDQNG